MEVTTYYKDFYLNFEFRNKRLLRFLIKKISHKAKPLNISVATFSYYLKAAIKNGQNIDIFGGTCHK